MSNETFSRAQLMLIFVVIKFIGHIRQSKMLIVRPEFLAIKHHFFRLGIQIMGSFFNEHFLHL